MKSKYCLLESVSILFLQFLFKGQVLFSNKPPLFIIRAETIEEAPSVNKTPPSSFSIFFFYFSSWY